MIYAAKLEDRVIIICHLAKESDYLSFLFHSYLILVFDYKEHLHDISFHKCDKKFRPDHDGPNGADEDDGSEGYEVVELLAVGEDVVTTVFRE